LKGEIEEAESYLSYPEDSAEYWTGRDYQRRVIEGLVDEILCTTTGTGHKKTASLKIHLRIGRGLDANDFPSLRGVADVSTA
jgi:hypothetical protein